MEQVIELEPGDADSLGSRRRYVWKTQLPYKLAFDTEVIRLEPPTLLEVAASGELEAATAPSTPSRTISRRCLPRSAS